MFKFVFQWTILFCLLPSTFFGDEIYRWVDDRGNIVFTDNPSNIPKSYSGKVTKFGTPQEAQEKQGIGKEKDESTKRVKKLLDEIEKRIEEKRQLEEKLSNLEMELKHQQDRLKRIEALEKETPVVYRRFVDPRTGKWKWGLISPYYDEKRQIISRMETLLHEKQSIEEKISDIKKGL